MYIYLYIYNIRLKKIGKIMLQTLHNLTALHLTPTSSCPVNKVKKNKKKTLSKVSEYTE